MAGKGIPLKWPEQKNIERRGGGGRIALLCSPHLIPETRSLAHMLEWGVNKFRWVYKKAGAFGGGGGLCEKRKSESALN